MTLSLSGRPNLQAPYRPMLTAAPEAAAPFCYHCPLGKTYPECDVACADELEAVIRREGPETVAAFIAEPILGASAGAAVPPEDYARKAREICTRHGVVYIDDEVMTGFGRTGALLRHRVERGGARPRDLRQGHERGATCRWGRCSPASASSRPWSEAGGFTHGFTFSHNPVTAAACLETLRILEDERLVARAARTGRARSSRGSSRSCARPHVGDVRGRGLMAGVELVADKATRRPFPRSEKKAEAVAAQAFAAGLVIYPSTGCADGTDGDLVMLAPPFVATEDEIDEMTTILERTLDRPRALDDGARLTR